jgi:glycosyltransferase involved in cell wall biosynthesis
MKVLHLSKGDLDGGAARGSYWLHRGMIQAGVKSQILVKNKISDDASVFGSEGKLGKYVDKIKGTLEQISLIPYPERNKSIFSPAWTWNNIPSRVKTVNPDIINLHWICGGFLNVESIGKLSQISPLVWTIRDMWPFTGGCHYSYGCMKYHDSCGSCPQLKSSRENDLSRSIWNRKNNSWKNCNITVVAISQWLANCAKKSSLFENCRIEVIHNALDEQKYKPIDKQFARNLLNLPQDKKIILFGAISATKDERKGFKYLIEALKQIDDKELSDHVELVIFGSSQSGDDLGLRMKTHFLGRLYDDVTLALTYSAGDVMIVPSIEEAFGKTAMESLACGTPVVSFDSTGLKDIVDHQKNGYCAECFNSEDLAQGIRWVLENDERWQKLSENARKTVEEKFTLKHQVEKYLELYQDVIERQKISLL